MYNFQLSELDELSVNFLKDNIKDYYDSYLCRDSRRSLASPFLDLIIWSLDSDPMTIWQSGAEGEGEVKILIVKVLFLNCLL